MYKFLLVFTVDIYTLDGKIVDKCTQYPYCCYKYSYSRSCYDHHYHHHHGLNGFVIMAVVIYAVYCLKSEK